MPAVRPPRIPLARPFMRRMTIVRARYLALAVLPLLAAKDLRGAIRNYEPGAVLVAPGGAPVTGAAAIEGAYAALIGDPNFKIAMKPGKSWAAESGELAVTTATGTVTTTDAASGEAVTVPIANQTVWQRA